MQHDYLISAPKTPMAKRYEICVIMPVFNRPECLGRCLDSLYASDLSEVLLVLLDDGSEDASTVQLLTNFNHPQADCLCISRRNRTEQAHLLDTLHHNIMFACHYVLNQFNASYLVVLDSDVIVKRNWLRVLHSLYERQADKPNILISGFNTLTKPTLRKEADYWQKGELGGVNLFFSSELYKSVCIPMQPFWDEHLVRRMINHNYRMLASKPSVVQHIGWQGTFSRNYFLTDRAFDFDRFSLDSKLFYDGIKRPFIHFRMFLSRLKQQILRR